MKTLLLVYLFTAALQAPAQTGRFEKNNGGITVYPVTGHAGAVNLRVWNSRTIQVTASPLNTLTHDTCFVTAGPFVPGTAFQVKDAGTQVRLVTKDLQAAVNKSTGQVIFYNTKGDVILAEKKRSFTPMRLEARSAYGITQQFHSPETEALYGLGQHQQGIMNQKGARLTLYQNNTEVFVPYLVSSRQYGLLWDNYSLTEFGDGRDFAGLSSLQLYSKDGVPGGLSARYFSKSNSQLVYAASVSTDINYADLGLMKNLPASFKLEDGKAVWEGFAEAPSTGTYTLRLLAGGYLKCYVNGRLVLDRWRQCWNPFTAFVPLQLKAGVKAKLLLEWIPDGGESYIACHVMPPPAAEQKTQYHFTSEAASNISYFFVYGHNYDDVIAGYRTLTGRAPLVPKWALGFWQSRERYKTQAEMLNTVKTFREKKIPLDNIVLDWQYWKPDEWGSQQFDLSRFPAPDTLISSLHNNYNTRFMISVWPKFYKGIPGFEKMYRSGYLLNRNADENRKDWLGFVSTFYDVYNPAARAAFWQLLRENLYNKGIDAWWMDAPEPDIHSNLPVKQRQGLMYPNALGSAIQYFNNYPLQNSQAIYEGQKATNDNKRVFILTRSAFAGIQRYGSAVWSGDIGSTWADMKNQVAAGVNFSMSGVPWWTFDAGGFAVEKRFEQGQDSAEWKELQARWYQFGGFMPLFRAHGQFPFREPFHIAGDSEPAFKAMKRSIEWRYRLLPHLYSLAADVHFRNGTMLRGLMMDFPNDPQARNINDQLMCGTSLLVNPVCSFGARSRPVYLPAGAGWYDFYSGRYLPGGQTIQAAAPLEQMPVFVKAGSIIITGPEMQYSTEKPADTLTVTIYDGADAAYTLYEDENDNCNYEKGAAANIRFSYHASKKQLTIHQREGQFNGMLSKRVFRLVRVHAGGATSAVFAAYNGNTINLSIN